MSLRLEGIVCSVLQTDLLSLFPDQQCAAEQGELDQPFSPVTNGGSHPSWPCQLAFGQGKLIHVFSPQPSSARKPEMFKTGGGEGEGI